jgi:ATP-dependent exoDNAse (exonuclease V) beta subunit
MLSFLEDPSDDEVFVILARSPWVGADDLTLADWGRRRGRRSFWDWLMSHPSEYEQQPKLKRLMQAVESAQLWPLSILFEQLLEEFGLFQFCLVGDGSGRREANLRKLVATLKGAEGLPGFSAAEFIDSAWRELQEAGEENEAASFVEPQRVNVMTVHKSKGLKFGCVIIPSCGDPMKPKTPLLVLDPSGKWAIRVLSQDSEEKVSPLAYEKLKEARFQRELEEGDRVFYVAVTRAADEVCLIGRQPGKSGFSAKSWFSHTKLLMTPGSHPQGYCVTQWEEPPVHSLKTEFDRGEKIEAVRLPDPLKIVGERFTVTEVVQNMKEKRLERMDATARIPKTLTALAADQRRGQAIHFVFEHFINSSDTNISELCEIAEKKFGAMGINPQYVSDTLRITDPPLVPIMKNGHTEWPFEFREGGFVINGQIDLWGDVDGITWIVDYKSAKRLTDEARRDAHEQLELYALAVHKAGRDWEKIRLAVITPLDAQSHILELRDYDKIRERIIGGLGKSPRPI